MKRFEYVIAIAEAESISSAAERLNVAQSSLSRYLAKLESDLGIELFDRSTLPLRLTEAGRCYVSAGTRIIDLNRQLMKQLDEIKYKKDQQLRIGTGPSRAPVLIPRILDEFSRKHPGVQILTTECRTAELVEQLSDGRLDLIVSFLDSTTEGFGMEDLFQETVFLAVHRQYADAVEALLDADGQLDLQALTLPFVSLHEGQQLRNALDLLSGGQIVPRYVCEYLESAMALVDRGLAVTLAPSYWQLLSSGSDRLRYFPVRIPDTLTPDELHRLNAVMHRQIGVFYRKEQFLSELEKDFIACAKATYRDGHI